MTTSIRVLGVLGWCWVDCGRSTQFQTPEYVVLRASVLGVLGLCTRTRMRIFYSCDTSAGIKPHANSEIPNTPNTHNTDTGNQLISLGFKCVGYVLGWLNVCWVLISGGL